MKENNKKSWLDKDISINFKKFKIDDLDFLSLLNRNVILLIVSFIFIIINYVLVSYFYASKIDLIEKLEEEQKIVNEKFITAHF